MTDSFSYEQSQPRSMLSRFLRSLFSSVIQSIIVALILVVCVRVFLFRNFSIPSGSMIPTIEIGDQILVAKFAYGYSGLSLFGHPYFEGRIFGRLPDRGDVVVFMGNDGVLYVKRVMGLPGDRVQMRKNMLYINDRPLEAVFGKYILRVLSHQRVIRSAIFTETTPEGHVHQILDTVKNAPSDNTEVYKVPKGHLFMMGDNRDYSQDSRDQEAMGYIPVENVIGKAWYIYLSFPANAQDQQDGLSALKNLKNASPDRIWKVIK